MSEKIIGFPKPGKKKKVRGGSNHRDPKLLKMSRDRPCSNPECNNFKNSDGTTVRAHYTGFRQHLFEKGMGIKGHDDIAADLCFTCHQLFDQPKERKSISLSELFLTCIMITRIRDRMESLK